MYKIDRYMNPYVLYTVRCIWVATWLTKHSNINNEKFVSGFKGLSRIFKTIISHRTLMCDICLSIYKFLNHRIGIYSSWFWHIWNNFSNVNYSFSWDTNKVTISDSLYIKHLSKPDFWKILVICVLLKPHFWKIFGDMRVCCDPKSNHNW